jgi:hypothetical protein
MDSEERLAQHHPSPHCGVEGSWRACLDQVTSPQPSPPASPSGVAGWSRRLAGPQQHSDLPHPSTPSRTAPTWDDIARGGTPNTTHQEAPAASPADTIALYKRYTSMGLRARFSIRNTAGYEEINLTCRFPELPAARSHPPRRHHRKRNRQRDRDKPTLRQLALKQSRSFIQRRPIIATTCRHRLWPKPP